MKAMKGMKAMKAMKAAEDATKGSYTKDYLGKPCIWRAAKLYYPGTKGPLWTEARKWQKDGCLNINCRYCKDHFYKEHIRKHLPLAMKKNAAMKAAMKAGK